MRLHLRSVTITLVAGLLATAASAAFAASPPLPKVMSDSPLDKGSWRMEILEAPGRDAKAMQAMGAMTVCTSAAEAMTKDRGNPAGKPDANCTSRLLEDRADRATMEVACSGEDPSKLKSTIVRVAPRSYEVTTETSSAKRPQPVTMKMKMSYAGACSASDAVVKSDQTAAMCAHAKPQLAQMDPAKCPKGNSACVQQMTTARAQIEALCK